MPKHVMGHTLDLVILLGLLPSIRDVGDLCFSGHFPVLSDVISHSSPSMSTLPAQYGHII